MTSSPSPFLVSDDDRLECKATCGAILWLYQHAVTSYAGIGHDLDYEAIGYRHVFSARAADRSDRPLAGTSDRGLTELADLLGRGALFALCCELYDLLCDERRSEEVRAFLAAWQGAAGPPPRRSQGSASRPPWRRWPPRLARLRLGATPAGARLRRVMDAVYRQHVAGFLRDLAAMAHRW